MRIGCGFGCGVGGDQRRDGGRARRGSAFSWRWATALPARHAPALRWAALHRDPRANSPGLSSGAVGSTLALVALFATLAFRGPSRPSPFSALPSVVCCPFHAKSFAIPRPGSPSQAADPCAPLTCRSLHVVIIRGSPPLPPPSDPRGNGVPSPCAARVAGEHEAEEPVRRDLAHLHKAGTRRGGGHELGLRYAGHCGLAP